eukprot:UN01835
MKGTHYILYNRTTDSKILICSMEDTKEAIDKFDGVDTCALMLAADTLLSSMDSPSPLCPGTIRNSFRSVLAGAFSPIAP